MGRNTLWDEFFRDQNVRFPKCPKLIDGISIYDAPYGLGIQFRGGPKKLVIKGQTSSDLFKELKPQLNGELTLEEIFNSLSEYDVNDVATVLKLLHAHNLLTDQTSINVNNSDLVDPQISYFNRIAGRTGFNNNGQQIADSIKDSKVLLISTESLIPSFLHNFSLIGMRNVGLMYYKAMGNSLEFQQFFPYPLMTEVDISDKDENTILNELHLRAEDYQYVVVGFENPNRTFISNINDFCITRNIPVVFLTLNDNTFELGPYVIPKASACFVCSILRKNSYNQDAIYENIYQDGLQENKQLIDHHIKGIDLVSINIATGLLASDMMKIITGYNQPTLINNMTEFDSLSGHIISYPVFRVPGCLSCSN